MNESSPVDSPTEPAVELIDVRKRYRSSSGGVDALRGIDLRIEAGERLAVLGKSGCGKSTLLNLLGGLDRPSEGTMRVHAAELGKLGEKKLARYRRLQVGMVFQSFNLISSRTALQNVELPLVFSGISRRQRIARAREALASVHLSDRLTHRPSQLSGGQQQRVAIARALIHRPRLLLADEPTGNLDSRTADETVELLLQIASEGDITTVLVSHDEELAKRFATRIVRMRDGQITE